MVRARAAGVTIAGKWKRSGRQQSAGGDEPNKIDSADSTIRIERARTPEVPRVKHVALGHPKFAALRRRLSLDEWEGVGLLEAVWILGRRLAPRGDIGRFTNEQIAVGIGWNRTPPDELVSALVETRWFDPHDEYRLVIHGWAEHADGYVHLVVARMREFFADGSRPKPPPSIIPSHERPGILKFCKGKPPRKKPTRSTTGQGAVPTTGLTTGLTSGGQVNNSGHSQRAASPFPSAESETSLPPRTMPDRGDVSHDTTNGNGNGHEPPPHVATVGRVLELFATRFPHLMLEDQHDHGNVEEQLEARVAEYPELGTWEHWAEQLAKIPFFVEGRKRNHGKATLAFLTRTQKQVHDVLHRVGTDT